MSTEVHSRQSRVRQRSVQRGGGYGKVVTAAQRRRALVHLKSRGVSESCACCLVGLRRVATWSPQLNGEDSFDQQVCFLGCMTGSIESDPIDPKAYSIRVRHERSMTLAPGRNRGFHIDTVLRRPTTTATIPAQATPTTAGNNTVVIE